MQPIQYSIEKIGVDLIERNPDNARSSRDESRIIELAADLKANGLICPLIGFRHGKAVMLVDGHLRLDAAHIAGLKDLSVLVCDRVPTRPEILSLQARIDAHRQNFNAVELSDLLAKLQAESRCTVTDLAQQINRSQSFVSKLLSLQRVAPEIREQVRVGTLDVERAYLVASAESDPAKQATLAKQASTLSREQLRQHINAPGRGDAKASAARFTMPGGMQVAISGRDLTLTCVIELLGETVRVLKKGLSQGLDITTQMRVMLDQSKQLPKSASRQPSKGE